MIQTRGLWRGPGDFKGGDKDSDDLFAGSPPLGAKRLLLSRAVTRKGDGRKMKAHLNPRCEGNVYIELPEECGLGTGYCGKFNVWSYGFRPAAAAWGKHYAELFEGEGFKR